LFISDNNGLLWKHIDLTINGKNTINDHLKVETNYGLSVSPDDSLYFSFSGISANAGIDINIRKSINDIEKNNFWDAFKVSNSNMWWDDNSLYNIHFAANSDWYSSFRGNINSGATYYLKDGGNSWTKLDYGLGLNTYGLRSEQHFAEASGGKIFMVQWMDERIYWTDASITTSTDPVEENLTEPRPFPNPVNRNESFSIRLDNWNICKINIYDNMGRKIISETGLGSVHEIKAPVNSGIYYIEVSNKHSRKTASLLVK
ncbi:MAG TPA: T9SS type A sorting domain-containing protein, partial [Draconibacterium sp.]|nr:T9SS type A sorting domain-containing protein [Draconibacterium sp.]